MQLGEISFAQVLIRLFEAAQRFNMEVQPQLILLQKTLLNIEGLGRQLYPELDLWETGHPFFKEWMGDQLGGRAVLSSIRENLPQLRDAMRELPVVIKHLADQAAHGDLRVRMDAPEIRKLRAQLEAQQKQRFRLTISMTAVVCGTLLLGLETAVPALGWSLLGLGALGALWSKPGR